jgi:DNA-binding HxlR family transcriptional regulator
MLAIPEPPIVSAQHGLQLLRNDLNRSILAALATAPMNTGELCARLMLESDTTLREQLEELERIGTIERLRTLRSGAGAFQLVQAGDDLLGVMETTGTWLTRRPGRALSPESDIAWRALAALGDGWELSLIQHLLVRPSTRAELLMTIAPLTKQKAKRILRRLQGAGLVRALEEERRGSRYALSEWARRAIAVLAAIAQWERTGLSGIAQPVVASDGAIALLAALPLVQLPVHASGVCAFTVEAEGDRSTPRSSAVWARLSRGRVVACRPGRCPSPLDAWVHGGIDAWLDAVIDAHPSALHLGGDRALAEGVLRSLHEELYGT